MDEMEMFHAGESPFFTDLLALPGSYSGPDGLRPEPYGLVAYGEASSLPRVFSTWVDAPLVVSGTQFVFAGGFDYGDAAPFKLSAELAGAGVIVLGHGVHEPNFPVPPGPLSVYTYAGYLAHATGHREAFAEADRLMGELLEVVRPEVETAHNPAKTLAWNLWNRVPLLLTCRRQPGVSDLVARVFARVGKALTLPLPDHPLEILAAAFEGRHGLGDDVVALVLGPEDDETRLGIELLETRVAQVERLALPFGGRGAMPEDAGANALAIWYLGLWVAGYLALLHKLPPEDTEVYRALRTAAPLEVKE